MAIGIEDFEAAWNLFDSPRWWEAATTLSHYAHQVWCRETTRLLWLLLRSLETKIIGLGVTMIVQLNERSISGFIAFLVSSVRSPHFDWNGMQDHYEVEYHHLVPLNSRERVVA